MEKDFEQIHKSKYTDLFLKFLQELCEYSKTGKIPTTGNQDIRYYLELQDKRLEKFGISMILDIKQDTFIKSAKQIDEMASIINSVKKINDIVPIKIDDYLKFIKSKHYGDIKYNLKYLKNNKRIYKIKGYRLVYETIIEADEYNLNIGDETYVCPNCGSISKISTLKTRGFSLL